MQTIAKFRMPNTKSQDFTPLYPPPFAVAETKDLVMEYGCKFLQECPVVGSLNAIAYEFGGRKRYGYRTSWSRTDREGGSLHSTLGFVLLQVGWLGRPLKTTFVMTT